MEGIWKMKKKIKLEELNNLESIRIFAKTEEGKKYLVLLLAGLMIGVLLKFILIGIAILGVGYLVYKHMKDKKSTLAGNSIEQKKDSA